MIFRCLNDNIILRGFYILKIINIMLYGLWLIGNVILFEVFYEEKEHIIGIPTYYLLCFRLRGLEFIILSRIICRSALMDF